MAVPKHWSKSKRVTSRSSSIISSIRVPYTTPCMMSVDRRPQIRQASMMLLESWTLLWWYQLPARRGNGSVSVRPRYSMVKKPSGMSTLGVPYSPIVPSLTRCASGQTAFMA